MSKSIFIGFDFSMDKPAMTLLYDKQFNFVIWPLDMSKKQQSLYEAKGVHCYPRNLKAITSSKEDSSKLTYKHTVRSVQLANLIVQYIQEYIKEHNAEEAQLYIASEGLSFGSTGNAALNLATYKGVLLSKLYETFGSGLTRLCTYPPITIKSTANCATRDKVKDKNAMIHAFMQEKIDVPFRHALIAGHFKAKKNYIKCTDDIVDSYYALKTMLSKEGFI